MSDRPSRLNQGARARKPEGGFTLLELLVAVTLMAVVAVLSWRGLDALLGARERIGRAGDELRALSVAFSQVEEDLRRAWPVRLIEAGRPVVTLSGAVESADRAVGATRLDLLREAPAVAAFGVPSSNADPLSRRAQASGLQRVVWRLEGGRLERGFLAWWAPAVQSNAASRPGDSAAPVALDNSAEALAGMTWQPLIEGVEALAWRLYVVGSGWLPPGQPPEQGQTVVGVEVSLVRAGERILRVFSVRD
jgi:general secretion pathway protein J